MERIFIVQMGVYADDTSHVYVFPDQYAATLKFVALVDEMEKKPRLDADWVAVYGPCAMGELAVSPRSKPLMVWPIRR